jgi:hypothetical protein
MTIAAAINRDTPTHLQTNGSLKISSNTAFITSRFVLFCRCCDKKGKKKRRNLFKRI